VIDGKVKNKIPFYSPSFILKVKVILLFLLIIFKFYPFRKNEKVLRGYLKKEQPKRITVCVKS